MAPIHSVLLPANIIIIVGGVMVANDYDVQDQQTNTAATDQEHTSKLLRSIGSGIFLAVAVFFNLCVMKTFASRENNKRRGTHPTLIILAVVGAFLIVRGTFGLLQAALYSVICFFASVRVMNNLGSLTDTLLHSCRILTLPTIMQLASRTDS